MRKSSKRYIKNLLRDYPNLDKYIKEREEELRHPYMESDENVGGGKAQFKQSEKEFHILVTIEQDRRLSALEKEKQVIQSTFESAGVITQKIIMDVYFKQRCSLACLVDEKQIPLAQAQAYRLESEFIQEVGDKLGVV